LKKKYNLILLIITIIVSFPFSFNNITQNNNISKDSDLQISSNPNIIIVGTMYLPVDLDPQFAWDSPSFNVIDQVCEGLYTYNLSDPDLKMIPNLASDYGIWNPSGTEFTVPLRQGVVFHDGTPFNATAVQWNWDRMAWALNATGTNTVGITQVAELYEWPDGTPIVSHTVVESEFVIKFVLNEYYAPFEGLLCFSASYIQSPTSTPQDQYLDKATSDLVGTGPWVYDAYEIGVEVRLHAFNDYWKGKANIDELLFCCITDTNARNMALLNG